MSANVFYPNKTAIKVQVLKRIDQLLTGLTFVYYSCVYVHIKGIVIKKTEMVISIIFYGVDNDTTDHAFKKLFGKA